MKVVVLSVLALGSLAACTTTADDGMAVREPSGECSADAAQRHIGQRATQELGAELLRVTRARQLRWAPPDSAMTMDFRPDRLTVSYDRSLMVDRISCG
ncbi:I78 family peptidase inhibitor [Aurantiacibacter luteus]|uniref:Peptidase inhibitor I78 n=1 Tax=Aurantiacibacter luteus TaxID=1581420 RepID=A0A0G9MVJ0_9SPHN|nr:I78 family peptidase inhibitor [Aurantiacibacter luteus]KLE34720.1 hypothetical protein AAW00_11225 [Aurantiacibacter luteus]